jgi:tetratricopeptide (TPR) repeat protein
LTGAEDGFGSRLGRILYDLDAPGVSLNGAWPLEKQLDRLIEQDPGQAVRFVSLASEDVPYAAAGFAATIALVLARLLENEPATQAMFLNNAANFLSTLGRREDALAAATEAVGLYRDLARARPEAFTPDLATSLSNLANGLSELGRREDALAAATEAVTIRRDLARARPEAFTPDLTMSVNNLANRLSEPGRREDALAAATEAVTIRRDLARARPEAFTPNLGISLNNLARILFALGRREEAVAAAQEAAALRGKK